MGRSSRRLGWGVWGLACVFSVARGALAFCRTTTCDPNHPTAPDACQYEDGCAVNGTPLYWPNACVAFSAQKAGSPKRGIDFAAFDAVVSDALYEWSHVDCGAGEPSIGLFDRSPVDCARVQYNSDAPNANIWMFRDADWPYSGQGTLALTTVTYSPSTAQIYDADVEINSADNRITVGDTSIRLDLKSIVIHEAGHTLGLSHSPVTYATMAEYYDPMDVSFRSLSDDDVQAAAQAAAIHEVILSFPDGYNTLIGEKGVTLSGGQKQRVAIARALLKNPRILILDDATSSVDTGTEAAIREALENLMKERTSFVIAHRIQSLINADLILVLDKGKIIQQGNHSELVQLEGMYQQIYRIQTRIESELQEELASAAGEAPG